MKKIAVSVGDLNGISMQIALLAHDEVKKYATPIYLINEIMLKRAAKLLNIKIPKDFKIYEVGDVFEIEPGVISQRSGEYSYESFLKGVKLAKNKKVAALVTLPINKEAWKRAGIKYAGHTEALGDIFKKEAIMMIGSPKLYCAFFTHHIPLRDVAKKIKRKKLQKFLVDFYENIKEEPIGVLALNPHAGDGGVMGDEEKKIKKAIKEANRNIGRDIFTSPLVPDTAFTPKNREFIKYFVAMYHDQGLIAVKSLYFEESINVSLNLPIIRTSVDHGTAFDIAYKNQKVSLKSYINAFKEAVRLSEKRAKYII